LGYCFEQHFFPLCEAKMRKMAQVQKSLTQLLLHIDGLSDMQQRPILNMLNVSTLAAAIMHLKVVPVSATDTS
jgi:hypothetical protein